MSSTLTSRGRQILDYEQRIKALQNAKKNSISELNAELRQLETDRTTLREELNAIVASYKPRIEEPRKSSSLSSILSLKFGTASQKTVVDPMSVINAKRQRIEKMDALISQKRKNEEERQLQTQKINKEIRRIVDTISKIDRVEADKSKTEIWCLDSITRLSNQVDDARLSIDSYKKAIPLLIEAQKSIELIRNISDQNTDDNHMQKLAFNQLESNSLIADTCLAQAWNYLSIADSNHDDSMSALPPMPDDIISWAREVWPVVLELVRATYSCISRKEKLITDNEAELTIIQENLFQERKLVFIEAANGKSNLPSYNDPGPVRRANTTLPKSSTLEPAHTVLSKSNGNLPPLPPRTQSATLHDSKEWKPPVNNTPTKSRIPFDMAGLSFPNDSEPEATNNSFEKESLGKSVDYSLSLSDSLSHNWEDTPNIGMPKYKATQSESNITQMITKIDPISDTWQSDEPARKLQDKFVQDSWSKLDHDIPNEISHDHEPPKEINSEFERDMTISEKMDELYLENSPIIVAKPSSMMGLDDNPWS